MQEHHGRGAAGAALRQAQVAPDALGRPLVAPQAFTLITFETAVLGAVVACVVAMLLANRLPRLHHPLFELENFHLATAKKFFLVIQSNDPAFDADKTRRFLKTLKPVDVAEAPFAEEPE